MKKVLLIVGIILLLCGIVITPWAVLARSVEPITDPYPAKQDPETLSWHIAANYSAQQRLILKVAPGKDWAMYAEPTDDYQMGTGIPADVLTVILVVTDPKGGKTKAELAYIAHESEGQIQRNLYFFAYRVFAGYSGLSFEESTITERKNTSILVKLQTGFDGQFVGITNYDGRYDVNILQNETGVPYPPSTLTLLRQPVKFVQPFLFIAPIGGVFMVLGGYAAILGRKKAERGLRLKK